jgi:hypothetical protein
VCIRFRANSLCAQHTGSTWGLLTLPNESLGALANAAGHGGAIQGTFSNSGTIQAFVMNRSIMKLSFQCGKAPRAAASSVSI